MIRDVYQCCYTNSASEVGGVITSGWKPVAYSQNLPKDALDGVVHFQKGNSIIKSSMMDENGNDLNILEIVGDGTYLYVMRTQYGLKDVRGRRNMFSHAYCFPWNDEMLYDPNTFLTIDKSNFAISEEEALENHAHFTRMPSLDMKTALQYAEIETAEELASLIDAVYEQMANNAMFEPLYVQYDGSERQLAALLYCIYTYLPAFLRRKLVSASAEGNNVKLTNIVFSQRAARHRFFFDSHKDNSNMLQPARRSSIRRLGFVDYAALNMDRVDPRKYFERLEALVASFSISSTSAAQIMLAYKIAHQMLTNPKVSDYSDDLVDRSIDEALRLRTTGSKILDQYLVSLLKQMVERKLTMIDGLDKDLDERMLVPHSAELDKVVEKYNMFVFEQLPEEEAVRKLRAMTPEALQRHFASLKKSEKGVAIFESYFISVLNDHGKDWKSLAQYIAEVGNFFTSQRIDDAVQQRAWDIFCSSIKDVAGAPETLKHYLDIMALVLPANDMQECKNAALDEFWDSVDVDKLDAGNLPVYRSMDNNGAKAQEVLETLPIYEALSDKGEQELLREFYAYSMKHRYDMDAVKQQRVIQKLNAFIGDSYEGADKYLADWVCLVSIMPNTSALEELLAMRGALMDEDFVGLPAMIESFAELARELDDRNKLLRKTLDHIYNYCADKEDDSYDSVPLDVWLTIGKHHPKLSSTYGGPLAIFDWNYKPLVLEEDPAIVVDKSELIRTPFYREYAKQYLEHLKQTKRRRGIEFKAVRDWLRITDRLQKVAPNTSRAGRVASDDEYLRDEMSVGLNEPEQMDTYRDGRNYEDTRRVNIDPFADTEAYTGGDYRTRPQRYDADANNSEFGTRATTDRYGRGGSSGTGAQYGTQRDAYGDYGVSGWDSTRASSQSQYDSLRAIPTIDPYDERGAASAGRSFSDYRVSNEADRYQHSGLDETDDAEQRPAKSQEEQKGGLFGGITRLFGRNKR